MAWPDDGDKYIGKWKDDKRHGQGTYIWGKGKWEGNKYVGEWKDGVKHGQGTYTKANGLKFVGEFKDGERWNGTVTDKEGNVIEKIEDGDCDSFFFCEF